MEFSFALHHYIVSFLAQRDIGFTLIFICAFGIMLFTAVIGIPVKQLKYFQKLRYMIIMPLVLTWLPSTFLMLVLYTINTAPIKMITVIVSTYALMFIFCLLNLNTIIECFTEFNQPKKKT